MSKTKWIRRLSPKQIATLLGFFTSMLGTIGSFLLLDVLSQEIRQLSDRKAAISREIEKLQAGASEYFFSSQQGDLVYALSLQSTARQDLVGLLYKGNLLDRATPVRTIIGALAISKVLDYRATYGKYEALNDAARQELSFERFVAVKEFERELVEQATKRITELFDLAGRLSQEVEAAERRLAGRQRFALALSVLGASLLLLANLSVDWKQSRQLVDIKPTN